MNLIGSITLALAFPALVLGQTAAESGTDESMTVTEKKLEQETMVGVLGSRPLRETPFSIQSFDAALIESEGQVTANQVLRHDPGLTNVATAGGFSAFNLSFRGFPSGADAITFEGLGPGAMFSGSLGQLFSVERLEVIKGPSAGLGALSPNAAMGGTVNIVPKQPLSGNRQRVSLTLRERGIFGGHLDLNRLVREGTALRLNLASESGTTFYGGRDERDVLALALRQSLGADAELILGYDQLRIRSEGYQNAFVLAPGIPVPRAPNPSRNHFQKWSWLEQEWNYGYGSLQWDFAADWKVFIQGLYGIRRRPLLSSGTGLIENEEGDLLLRPNYFAEGTRYKPFFGANVFLSCLGHTGSVKHHLTLASLNNGFTFITAQGPGLAPLASNLDRPVYTARPALETVVRGPSSEVDAKTLALSDDMQLTETLSLLLGVKQSFLRTDSFNVASGEQTARRGERGTTPFGAVSLKIQNRTMTYLSYIEGLGGGTAPPTAANAGEILPAARNYQLELGVKTEELRGLFLSAAFFDMKRPWEYVDFSNVYRREGIQRHRGLELQANGRLLDKVKVQAGLLLLDPRLHYDGERTIAPGAPKLILPLTLDYEWNETWMVSGSLYHGGRQFVDPNNTHELKSWTRFDAGVRYAFRLREQPATLQVRVENIGQPRYWASAAGGQLVLGPPEIWKLALRMDI